MKRLIVFDFDGVIADSEILANAVLVEIVTELGVPMALEASLQTFTGKRFDEVIAMVKGGVGRVKQFCADHVAKGDYFPGCPAQVR